MAVSRVIEVSFGRSSVALVRIDTAYFYNNGILFKPTDLDLPASYQVHWADSPQASSTLETIGTAEGAPIPDDLWNRSRVIYGWIYLHPTEDSGITAYEVRIYKNVRAGLPDGTEPTPEEQSTIDQAISALNTAVAKTAQDVISADQSAQSAESAKTAAESARDTAGEYANDAESSAASASTSASQASTSATASAQSASQSAQIKADVEDLVDDAQSYANASAQSATASANSASDAQGYAQSASASAQSASGYASSAQTSAQTASQKATEASQSASQALSYKTDAESAKTASQTAQGLTESARDTAVSAKTDAESARDDAETARDEAQQAVASISGALDDKAPVITDTASGAIASFSDGADDLPLKSLIVDINPIQDLSNGNPSPENICPISGWTQIGVNQSGVNVWDEEWESGDINVTTGEPRDNASRIRSKNFVPVRPNTVFYGKSSYPNTVVCFYGKDKEWVTPSGYAVAIDRTFTTPSWCYWIKLYCNTTAYAHDISINYPSTDHDYHPYTGQSITIDLGQTVYGGHLDVLSGEMVIDRKMQTITSSMFFSLGTSSGGIQWAKLDAFNDAKNNGYIFADRYANTDNPNTNSTIRLINNMPYIYDNRFVDNATAKALIDGVVCVYELAEPIEIQLSANQINSLYGVNNIWADSGDTEVEYRADTKLFIERLTAPDSADMVADANITSGQYFMVGNSLYKATSNIANGAQIVVGTNCTRKSLSEALNEINA